jgi:hypothetical protein
VPENCNKENSAKVFTTKAQTTLQKSWGIAIDPEFSKKEEPSQEC